jgi:hypothetical protein
VDKPDFLHRLNGLPAFEGTGKGLFLTRTLTGQKTGSMQAGHFRTFNPVDMHGFIHSGDGFAAKQGVFRRWRRARSPCAAQVAGRTGVENFFLVRQRGRRRC